jgi:nanoRNase/pAp phosphatase (c-di-AMP/oligoRNAs hydrolase)
LEIIKIDHHDTDDDYGTYNLINKNASSTGEMIAE